MCPFNAGDDGGAASGGSWSMDTAVVLSSKIVHISSAILAAKSPYFYKVCAQLDSHVGLKDLITRACICWVFSNIKKNMKDSLLICTHIVLPMPYAFYIINPI